MSAHCFISTRGCPFYPIAGKDGQLTSTIGNPCANREQWADRLTARFCFKAVNNRSMNRLTKIGIGIGSAVITVAIGVGSIGGVRYLYQERTEKIAEQKEIYDAYIRTQTEEEETRKDIESLLSCIDDKSCPIFDIVDSFAIKYQVDTGRFFEQSLVERLGSTYRFDERLLERLQQRRYEEGIKIRIRELEEQIQSGEANPSDRNYLIEEILGREKYEWEKAGKNLPSFFNKQFIKRLQAEVLSEMSK